MSEIEIEDFETTIPAFYDYNNFKDIEVVEADVLSYKDFFEKFMVRNIPCIIRNISHNWECVQKWIIDGNIDYDYFNKLYGNLEAPVADCSDTIHNSHSKKTMKVHEYINYLNQPNADKLLYLKDWHLRRLRPDDKFYEVPSFFASDWLNEYAEDNQDDDHMFVYIGPKDTWTPLHADVYCSYSWSVNVIGRKKWILFPPGEEIKLRDELRNLPLQYNEESYPGVKSFEVIQEAGDALFVPSGWFHQVVNLVVTISINHNWINSCNIQQVWESLQNHLIDIEEEISHLNNSEEFPVQCQIILKSLFGMNLTEFTKFICHIGKKRLNQIKSGDTKGFSNFLLGMKHIKLDLIVIVEIMKKIEQYPPFLNKNVTSNEIENELLTLINSISQYLEF